MGYYNRTVFGKVSLFENAWFKVVLNINNLVSYDYCLPECFTV